MTYPEIASVEQLLGFAEALERAAAARYRLLAEGMRARGRKDLAALFAGLAREEARHESWVRERRNALAPAPEPAGNWPSALGEAPEQPDPEQFARMTVYSCLAEAVRNEQKAFAFFSSLAAEAADPQVQETAEELAKQELEHASILRQARRRAYREVGRARSVWPRPSEIDSREALDVAARAGEAEVFRLLGAACGTMPALAPIALQLCERARRLDLEVEVPTPPERSGGAYNPALFISLLDNAEAAFDFYDAVAAGARDERAMLRAQDLMRFALARLNLLHGALG